MVFLLNHINTPDDCNNFLSSLQKEIFRFASDLNECVDKLEGNYYNHQRANPGTGKPKTEKHQPASSHPY